MKILYLDNVLAEKSTLQGFTAISRSFVKIIIRKVLFILGRDEEHQKDPQTEDENEEENESQDESSEEEDSEEADDDDEDKLLDDPNVKECIAVGNFNAQQEGDLTFTVNMSLSKFFDCRSSRIKE